MAGYSPEDICKVSGEEETVLKQLIADSWSTMKRTNWDDTKYCTINPKNVLTYSQAKNFKFFFDNEGWFVIVKKAERNYKFEVYKELAEAK